MIKPTKTHLLLLSLALFLGINVKAEARELRVLTFNAWFLPGISGVIEISKHDAERLAQLPDLLADTGADVIALQEVWTGAARKALKDGLYAKGYIYVAEKEDVEWSQWLRLQGALIGNGLMIFSRHEMSPVVNQRIFSSYTRLDEYFTIKGAIHVKINLPEIGWVDFYNTHLGAVSFDPATYSFNAEQLEVLNGQAQEFLYFIKEHRSETTQIVAGDMNQHPFNWDPQQRSHTREKGAVYALLTDKARLVDTFWKNRQPCNSAYTFNKNKNGYVFNGAFAESPDEYIDYIFVNEDAPALYPIESKIVLEDAIAELADDKKVFASDHAGVLTIFSTEQK